MPITGLEVALRHDAPVQLAVGQHHILEVERGCSICQGGHSAQALSDQNYLPVQNMNPLTDNFQVPEAPVQELNQVVCHKLQSACTSQAAQ